MALKWAGIFKLECVSSCAEETKQLHGKPSQKQGFIY